MAPDSNDSHSRINWRETAIEVGIAALILLAWAGLGWVTGWMGRPKTAISTTVWPFYFDTWFHEPVFTWRILITLGAFGLVIWPLRRFLAGDSQWYILPLLVFTAWGVHLACGVQRWGFPRGLEFTFSRPQEYWADVHYVTEGFLRRFPDVGRLSQHGATHPPGLTLVLAAVAALGAKTKVAAELVCSTSCALTAFPLYGAARRLTDEEIARAATALFLFACSVTAFAVLAMDAVTMLFAAVALYGLARALDGDLFGGALWGVALAATTLCTLTGFMLGLGYAVLLFIAWRRRSLTPKIRRALALGPIAFLLVYGILIIGFGYRPMRVFEFCWQQFAASDDSHRNRFAAIVGAPVAFLGALGLPIFALALRSAGGAIVRLRRLGDDLPTVALIGAALLPPLFCTLSGKPRGEIERVYLIFTPLAVLAATAAARRWYHRPRAWFANFAVPILVAQSILVEIFFNTLW